MTMFISMAVMEVQQYWSKSRSLPVSLFFRNEVDDFEEDSMGSVVYHTIESTRRRGVHTDPDYVHPLVCYKKEGKLVNEKGKHLSGIVMCAGCMAILRT